MDIRQAQRAAEGVSTKAKKSSLTEAWALYQRAWIEFNGHPLYLAELGKRDLFFLMSVLLNRRDMVRYWLYDRCREVEASPNGHLDLWAREHYKDLADDTPMLTANRGWTTHGELVVGDMVYAPNGNPVAVQALSERYRDSSCYRLTFYDGAQLVAGAGHLWRARRKIRRRVANGRAVEWSHEFVETASLKRLTDIGTIESPIKGATQQLPVHPYVLGCWLGDGCSASGRIGCADPEIFERIKSLGYALSDSHCPLRAPFEMRTVFHMQPDLRELGILNKKHIPDAYLRGSVHQRMELLRGLMDTDGHCNTRGTATFCNQNEALAQQVWELATGLALRPRIRMYEGLKVPYWQVSMQAHADRNPFGLSRKAQRAILASQHRNCRDVISIERVASVPTRCVQVDGGMYLAGRELIPTHNSTIITYGKTIQDILASHGDNPLPEWHGVEPTFGIFSHTRPIAKKFLRQIKGELERNERLKSLYPDILFEKPSRDADKWSEDTGITVRRKSNPKEATVEAWGLVDGQPTSAHFFVRIYDDVVVRASVTNGEQIAKTTEAWELSINLGVAEGGFERYIGTRYAFLDTYHEMMQRGAATPRLYPSTDDGTESGNPVFLSVAAHNKKKKQGKSTFSAQMLQKPVSKGTATFDIEQLRFAEVRPKTINVFILGDPANSKKKDSDRTGFAVLAYDAQRNWYLVDGANHKMNLGERWDCLESLHKKWSNAEGVQGVRVGYERYGIQADIEHFQKQMELATRSFEIEEVNWVSGGMSQAKDDRIERLQPDFKNGKFFLPYLCRHNNELCFLKVENGEVKYEKATRETKLMVQMKRDGQLYRVLRPITRKDEEGRVYDLATRFIIEYLSHPAPGSFKDLLDATSRVYDLKPSPPVHIDDRDLEPPTFEDS